MMLEAIASSEEAEAVHNSSQAAAALVGRRFPYGTAGFRARGDALGRVAFRCGLLAALRAHAVGGGRATGVVVTASHNPAQDNGIKLIDGDGGMLHASWEKHAEALVAAADGSEVAAAASAIIDDERIDVGGDPPIVLVARDTRPTGPALLAAVMRGVVAAGGVPSGDADTVRTTPQLHWQVMARNGGAPHALDDYYAALTEGCAGLRDLLAIPPAGSADGAMGCVVVDCANGVGAAAMARVCPSIEALGYCRPTLANEGGPSDGSALNRGCGADYVQKQRRAPDARPAEFWARAAASQNSHVIGASLDGDADRVVFFAPPNSPTSPTSPPEGKGEGEGMGGMGGGEVSLMDGDKVAALVAGFLFETLATCSPFLDPAPRVGVVQTAYANGASTAFLSQTLGCEVLW